MNRLIALGVFIVLVASAAAFWIWQARRSDEAPSVAIPLTDYVTGDAWAARPTEPPQPVWEGGWAVDVFLVLQSAARAPASIKTLAARDAAAIADAASLGEGLVSIGPVYAPFYAASEASGDLARALGSYLENDNNGRAFVIATDRSLPPEFVDILVSDSLVRERFGGILRIASAKEADTPFDMFPDSIDARAYCPARFASDQDCVATVLATRRGNRRYIAETPPIGGHVTDGFLEWLEAHGVQLAEPLGDLEDVAVIEIRRPGETDPVRSGE